MNNGFVILAQNTHYTDYVSCAEVLARSIKRVMPQSQICLISNDKSDSKDFDTIIPLPYGDLSPNSHWKLINDWQVYEASPYEYTIKLEADMFIPTDISYWWDVLKERDLVVNTTIRNFKGEISDSTLYRGFIKNNNLPDVYNAITYFRKSKTAEEFFNLVKNIFENWEEYKAILNCNVREEATTDWAYSIAVHLMGVETCTLPGFDQMSMVHMKKFINELSSEDWTRELIYECSPDNLRVNTFVQQYPFHYHVKKFSKVLKEYYD
jgi:hypothetical protein